jgi:hypothetical protein
VAWERSSELVSAGCVSSSPSSVVLITDQDLQGILRAVGVSGGVAAAGVVETGDIIDIWRQLTDALGLA